MPQTGLIHPQHHDQHVQHGQQIRGYDEDWDDDVYYATACATGGGGSSGQAKTSDEHFGEDYRVSESEKSGRDRTSTKRHYMKIPNMRQLRAMRSTAGSLPTGVPPSSERATSPLSSLEKDLGDTATSFSPSGESSLPLVDRLTHSPALPREASEVCDNDHAAQGTSTASPPVDSAPSPSRSPEYPDERSPSSGSKLGENVHNPQQLEQRAQAVVAADRDCLVQLRGSPRFAKNRDTSLSRNSFSAGSPRGGNAFPTIDAEGRIKTRFLHTAVPQASGGGGSVGKKRRLLPNGVGPRLSPGAWPKLPGEQSSQAKRSRILDMDTHGTEEGQDADDPAATSRKEGAVTVLDGYQDSPKRVDAKRQRHRERERLSSSGSSSSLSATPDGDPAAIDGSGTDAPKRGPSIMDRPARWTSKGGAFSSRSPLRPPGARARPPLPSRGSSGIGNSTNGTKGQQSRLGFPGRAERRARGASRGPLADEKEGRTLKLSAVFQATSSSSSRLRLKSRRGSSPHPPVRGGQGDTSDMPSFDPTCIGTTGCSAKETEEVEDVASDEEDPMGDGCASGFEGVVRNGNRFANGLGRGRGGELRGGTVDDFEEQLLGEDGSADDFGSAGKSSQEMGRSSARAIVIGTDDDGAGAKGNGRAIDSRSDPLASNGRGHAVAPKRDSNGPFVGNETSSISALEGLASRAAILSSPTREEGDVIAAAYGRAASRSKELPMQQQQQGRLKDASPPPRTPVPSRPRAFTPSSFKRGPSCSSSASGGHGKWRPSFGGGGDGSAARTPGSMNAPWAVFSTPSRASGDVSVGSGSTRRRGSGAGNGYLGKLLQQVRARFDGDEARLLSGEFPFRQTSAPSGDNAAREGEMGSDRGGGAVIGRRDHGDPRTRCRVALDVTVLPADGKRRGAPGVSVFGGDAVCDRMSGSVGLARFPCFVHGVVDVSICLSGSTSEKATADAGLFARLRVLEGTRVNALFKQDTRGALDLCAGSQLRIYDPYCISHSEAKGGALLMCTQLCEPFPVCFPPLPEPPDSCGVAEQSTR